MMESDRTATLSAVTGTDKIPTKDLLEETLSERGQLQQQQQQQQQQQHCIDQRDQSDNNNNNFSNDNNNTNITTNSDNINTNSTTKTPINNNSKINTNTNNNNNSNTNTTITTTITTTNNNTTTHIDVLEQVGLVDLVFPDTRGRHSRDDNDSGHGHGGASTKKSFDHKLREFVHFQPLSSHKAPHTPGAIRLSSPQGKQMMKEALDTPYMEAYFTVSPQIDNQPVFCCGTMCLVVALNSLDIDPGRATWSEEWRWNHLGSLSCCTTVLQNPDISIEQFGCLAVCNDALALTARVTDHWTLGEFRTWLKMALTRTDMVMVVNHGRREMKQAGSGHFLPMTGYHEDQDMILTYDIAKHKYVPEWFPLERMFHSVQARDQTTGLNRGFSLLMHPDYETSERLFGPSIVFRIDDVSGNTDRKLNEFLDRWNRFLDGHVSARLSREDIIKTAILHILTATKCISRGTSSGHETISLLELTLKYFRHHSSVDGNGRGSSSSSLSSSSSPSSLSSSFSSIIARCRRPQCPNKCPNTSFLHQIESTNLFHNVRDAMTSLPDQERAQLLDLVVTQLEDIDDAVRFCRETSHCHSSMERTVEFFRVLYGRSGQVIGGGATEPSNGNHQAVDSCPGFIELFPEHIATFLLLSWPYCRDARRNVFSHDAFVEILKEYNLPHLDDLGTEYASTNKGQRAEFHSNETCDGKRDTFREYLNKAVCVDLKALSLSPHAYRILIEQIRSVQRKFTIVLNYHKL